MSKMDSLRAMREARYEAATRARPGSAAPRRVPVAVAASAEAPADTEMVCGHRAISGRTCTREQGHAAKSHRYS